MGTSSDLGPFADGFTELVADGDIKAENPPGLRRDSHLRSGRQPSNGHGLTAPHLAYARSLPAETIEFSVSDATEKRVPFVRGKLENRTFGVPAVANADLALGQARHFDAVAVGETQRTLHPART